MNDACAPIDLVHTGGNQCLDFLGRVGTALCEATYLGGDHREPPPRITRAGGFDRSIQRQDVRLERDAVNHTNDVVDLGRRCVDVLHRGHHLPNGVARPVGHLRISAGKLSSLLCGAGCVAHRGADFLHRTGLLLQRGCRGFGTSRQIGTGGRDFVTGSMQLTGTVPHFPDEFLQRHIRIAQAPQQRSRFVRGPLLGWRVPEVACCHFVQMPSQFTQTAIGHPVKAVERIGSKQQAQHQHNGGPHAFGCHAVNALDQQCIQLGQ